MQADRDRQGSRMTETTAYRALALQVRCRAVNRLGNDEARASMAATLVLRYRRLLSMFAPSPWDVWDAFLDRYGIDAVFPVATTEIGRLAAIASEEILYPEIARAHAVKGAEILLHSTSEAGSPDL